MIKKILFTLSVFALFTNTVLASSHTADSTISFDNGQYHYRWSNADLHEFTPEGQPVEGQWKDMLTVNYYKNVQNESGLEEVVGAVVANYQEAGGIILGLEAVADDGKDPRDYVIAVVFGAQDIAEVAFVRFTLEDGMGVSLAYAHREYGENIAEKIDSWMQRNGPRVKDEVAEFTGFPSHTEFNKDGKYELLTSLQQSI